MNSCRSNCQATTTLVVLVSVIVIMVVAGLSGTVNARDPGFNQPGAAGNRRAVRR